MMKFSSVQNSRTISVIIPTCDRPISYLKAAVESALDQTLSPLEVLVIDNGTNAADRSQLPESVCYHRITPRIGVSRARNRGAELAQGSFLAFLDDDDWWDKDFLKEALQVLQTENSCCVYGRMDIFVDGSFQPYKWPTADNFNIPTLLERNPGAGGINLLIEKALFERVGGFSESLRTSEDKALAIEIFLKGERISFASRAVAVVRSHDGARLTDAKLARIRFIWKYRKLYGLRGMVKRMRRLVTQIRRDRRNASPQQ